MLNTLMSGGSTATDIAITSGGAAALHMLKVPLHYALECFMHAVEFNFGEWIYHRGVKRGTIHAAKSARVKTRELRDHRRAQKKLAKAEASVAKAKLELEETDA